MLESEQIERKLAAYLGAPLSSFRALASGWETTIFEFVLAGRSSRCESVPRETPLVLRCYQGPQADAKGRREHASIERLSRAGYCVPRPYAFEFDPDAIGAPFLVIERLAGGPLFAARSFPQAFKTFSLAFLSFVRVQTRLHRMRLSSTDLAELPRACIAGSVPPSAPLLDRVLARIAERVEQGPLPGLKDALRSLTERADQFRNAEPSIIHMDYHPQNVMVKGARVTGVIDWVNTDVGDRHLDAAMTSVILSSSALEHPRWMRDNLVGNTLRATFSALYIPLYHAMAPLEWRRFRYCQAAAAVLRLSMLGMMRARGAETVGFRPEAISQVTPGVIRLLTRYAARKSGASVRIDLAPQPA